MFKDLVKQALHNRHEFEQVVYEAQIFMPRKTKKPVKLAKKPDFTATDGTEIVFSDNLWKRYLAKKSKVFKDFGRYINVKIDAKFDPTMKHGQKLLDELAPFMKDINAERKAEEEARKKKRKKSVVEDEADEEQPSPSKRGGRGRKK